MNKSKVLTFSILSVAALALFVQKAQSYRHCSNRQDVAWTKFDEYSNISFDKEKARLNEFISLLRAEPNVTAYILAYAGQQACAGEAQERANRAKNYLRRAGGIRPARLQIVDAGYQENWQIDLYVAPPNSLPLMYEVIASNDGHLTRANVKVVKCKRKSY